MSRFVEISRAVLHGDDDIIILDRADFHTVLQGEKDLQELYLIWTILTPDPSRPDVWSRVRRVFGDTALPSKSLGKDSARDFQFELLVEAILTRAGVAPQHNLGGVDFTCTLGQRDFVVEAKRSNGLAKLVDRVSKAGDQIAASGKPGFAFVDRSEAVTPGDKEIVRVDPLSDAEMATARTGRWQFFWSKYERPLRRRLNGKRVLGLVFFDHFILQDGLDQARGIGHWKLATRRESVAMVTSDLANDVLAIVGDL